IASYIKKPLHVSYVHNHNLWYINNNKRKSLGRAGGRISGIGGHQHCSQQRSAIRSLLSLGAYLLDVLWRARAELRCAQPGGTKSRNRRASRSDMCVVGCQRRPQGLSAGERRAVLRPRKPSTRECLI
ncbi:jg24241, partial [Pararge aegeria aegeria]